MYGYESWTIKKAKCQRIDVFELWCWRRLLRVPWTARRSSQSNLKEINPEYSLEGLMLKLKLWYFGHLMQRADSLGKDPDARKVWRQEKGMTEDEMGRRYHWLNGHEFEQVPGDGDGQGSLACCSLLCCRVEHNRAAEQQQLPYVQEQIKPKASRWPLTREDMGMANKQKTFSTSFISREVKTVMRCYSTATKMAEI